MKSYRKSTGRKRRGVSWFGRGVEEMEPRVLLSSATFELTSDWGTGFGGQITIANTQSTAVNNWTLSFSWDRSITDIWDASITSHVGNEYTVTNAGWNSTIAPEGTR